MDLFRDWISRCEELHGWKCGRSIWPEPPHQKLRSFLVIDVYQMCILEAPESLLRILHKVDAHRNIVQGSSDE